MTAKVENGVATFEVPFKNGLNTLEAEISKNGKKIIDFYKLNMNLVPDQPKKFGNFRELNMLLGSNRSFEDRDADLAWMRTRLQRRRMGICWWKGIPQCIQPWFTASFQS